MATPDPVFSHLDTYAEIHHYGSLALKAAHVQNYIYYCHDQPGLKPALASLYRNTTPSDYAAEYKEVFDIDLLRLPHNQARLLTYYTLTGQLPPHHQAPSQREAEHAYNAIPIALALLQHRTPGHTYTAKLILSGLRRRLKIS